MSAACARDHAYRYTPLSAASCRVLSRGEQAARSEQVEKCNRKLVDKMMMIMQVSSTQLSNQREGGNTKPGLREDARASLCSCGAGRGGPAVAACVLR